LGNLAVLLLQCKQFLLALKMQSNRENVSSKN
jgi:hypothetical protein